MNKTLLIMSLGLLSACSNEPSQDQSNQPEKHISLIDRCENTKDKKLLTQECAPLIKQCDETRAHVNLSLKDFGEDPNFLLQNCKTSYELGIIYSGLLHP